MYILCNNAVYGILATAQQGANLEQIVCFTCAVLLKALLGSGPRWYWNIVNKEKDYKEAATQADVRFTGQRYSQKLFLMYSS